MLAALITSTDTKLAVPEIGVNVTDMPAGRVEVERPTEWGLPLNRTTETAVWMLLPGTTVPVLGESTMPNA